MTHSILEWHRAFFLGDTAQTLHPDYQERLEAEGNYGASALMFGGEIFTMEALDTEPCWASVKILKKRHDKSYVTTLRRYVEHSHDLPMAMVVSTPPWQNVPEHQEGPVRYFVKSHQFETRFGLVSSNTILARITENARWRSGGPLGDFTFCLRDRDGLEHEFRAESFFNRYDILTLLVHRRVMSPTRLIVSGNAQQVT